MMNIMEIKDTLKTIVPADSEKLVLKTNILTHLGKNPAATIISKSVELKAIETLVSIGSPFDIAKVAAIKLSVDAGDYKINPGDAADGLILSVQDFLTTDLASNNKVVT